jgi:DNA-binding MarR family transcriptional regulator
VKKYLKTVMKTPYYFSSKWSSATEEDGFTMVPNLLIKHQSDLNITDPEIVVLIAILSFKWTDAMPYPSAGKLGEYTGKSTKSVRDKLRSLETKGIIKRVHRAGASNEYDFTPLEKRLVIYTHPAEISVPTYRKTNSQPYRKFSSKEDEPKKTEESKRNGSSGKLTSLKDVLSNKHWS